MRPVLAEGLTTTVSRTFGCSGVCDTKCPCSASVEFLTPYAPHDPLRESEHKVAGNILFCAFVKRAENPSILCDNIDGKWKDEGLGYCFDCGVSVKGVLRLIQRRYSSMHAFPKGLCSRWLPGLQASRAWCREFDIFLSNCKNQTIVKVR